MELYNKVAIFSDLHLGLYKNDENWLKLMESWVDYFIEKCEKLGIEQILFLGDYFHYRDQIDVQTFQYGVQLLKKISDKFPVIMITGNHDCYLKETSEIHSLQSFKKWDNITVLDKYTTVKISDKNVAFVPWGCDIQDKNLDYIFGHFEIISFQWNKHSTCNGGLDPIQLVNKSKRIFSGHFHMNHEKSFKDKTITYIGSPLQHNFGDVGNSNGFYVLDFEKDTYEFISNVDFPEFKILKISKLKTDIKTIKKDFVKIILDSKITEKQLEKLTTKLNTIGVRDIQFESINTELSVDKAQLSDTIDKFDIEGFINEFIDTLDIDDNIKEKVKIKSQNLYKENIK